MKKNNKGDYLLPFLVLTNIVIGFLIIRFVGKLGRKSKVERIKVKQNPKQFY